MGKIELKASGTIETDILLNPLSINQVKVIGSKLIITLDCGTIFSQFYDEFEELMTMHEKIKAALPMNHLQVGSHGDE